MNVALWWLSFCDTTDAGRGRFLGACIVRAADLGDAVDRAWQAGCNPGGEVLGVEMPHDLAARVSWSDVGRLLSRAEATRYIERKR